jgi:outer membrane lipoprotein LolB
VRRLALALLLLAGCATPPPPGEYKADAWQQHQRLIAPLDHWRAIAKLGMSSPGKNASARLDWIQRGGDYRVALSGPLGFGSALIEGNAEIAQMQYDGKTLLQPPGALLLQAIGVALPVEAWHWWLRGIPMPDEQPIVGLATNSLGQATTFIQRGWTLSFWHYKQTALGYLPTKIRGENAALQFKLVVAEWRSPDAP